MAIRLPGGWPWELLGPVGLPRVRSELPARVTWDLLLALHREAVTVTYGRIMPQRLTASARSSWALSTRQP